MMSHGLLRALVLAAPTYRSSGLRAAWEPVPEIVLTFLDFSSMARIAWFSVSAT